ncbi:MAG: polysaccharide biosynthesis tyrosine autokinase [Wenzhouxiangella sp.]|nr:polysaccharide biosynthesis tyrosine autokinase [Wenzhouxiangella sp.]
MSESEHSNGRHLKPGDTQSRALTTHQNLAYSPEEDDREALDFVAQWNAILKRKWVVVSIIIIALGVGVLQTVLTVPVYRSTAVIQISPLTSTVLRIQDFEAAPRSVQALELYRETQFDILRGRQLAEDVVRRHEVWDPPELSGELSQRSLTSEIFALPRRVRALLRRSEPVIQREIDPEVLQERAIRRAGAILRSRIDVSPRRNSQLVNISVSSFDQRFAARIANAVVEEYIRSSMQRRYDAGQEAREFLETQLNEMRIALEQADQSLADFAQEQGVADLSERLGLARESLRRINSRLNETQSELLQVRSYRNLIQNGRGTEIRPVTNDQELQRLQAELAGLRTEHASLSQRFTGNHPSLVESRTRMAGVEQQISDRRSVIINNVLVEYANLEAEIAALHDAVEGGEAQILALGQRSVQYNILRREFETAQELYNGMLQRLREIGIASGLHENNIAMIDPASVAGRPFLPNPRRNLSLALIVGVALGIGLALFLEFLDSTIRRVDDLERLVGRPVLGLIPLVKLRQQKLRNVVSLRQEERAVSHYSEIHPKSSVSEAFRSLRTSLMFSTPQGMPKTLLVTSPGPGDGKTTNSINLATVMAQNGARVLLVDADLRKPRLHRDFGIPMAPGLTNRIAGISGDNSTSSIVATTVEGLFLMPAGNQAPNPAELLGSERMQKIITMAGRAFDHVIIDSAPILGLADALVLSRLVDGVIMVVAAGKTTKDSIKTGIRRLMQVQAPMLGTVINQVDMDSPDYAYYSSYYYNYYSDPEPSPEEVKEESPRAIGQPG